MKDSILNVEFSNIRLKNPVLVASGTFGYAEEYKDFIDVEKLGGIITKTITLEPKKGNDPPRIAETPCGLINSIGLQNSGLDDFIKNKLPALEKLNTILVVSIGGNESEDFEKIAERLDKIDAIDAIEINLSCPNVIHELMVGTGGEGKLLIAQDCYLTFEMVRAIRKKTNKVIIPKLSPNVTDMVSIARSCYDAGADALSIANTYSAMAVDIEKRKPLIGNITGGLSGPAIKPLNLRFVWEVSQAVDLPIIASGGIMSYKDALEFIITGANAVTIGTGNMVDVKMSIKVIEGIKKYLIEKNIKSVKDLYNSIKI